MRNADGPNAGPALCGPDGERVPDVRTDLSFEPSWSPNPFPAVPTSPRRFSRFRTDYLVYEALVQRGKGGVYKALDVTSTPLRQCVIKEGRRHGETDWNRQDGRARILAERQVLHSLASSGIGVPVVYEEFEEQGNAYIAIEYLGRSTLEDLVREAGVLAMGDALSLAAKMALQVAKVHEAGWAWRDCKPRNMVVGAADTLRPIDFEGACHIDSRGVPPWGSEGYVSPEWLDPTIDQAKSDLFALGVSCYQILVGRRCLGMTSRDLVASPIGARRREVRPEIKRLVAALLDADPNRRPSARTAAEVLSAAANS
ncbi:protein kinase [Streptomyces sp. NPDC059909]|uniref:protein kinase domain-containing protein n=1 Tax=Streptomyces sp. NPDC059909 TaxID=3346998 RepID=UPI00364D188A